MNVHIRNRIERQTPWRKGKIGIEISHLYTTLSAHIHKRQKGGDALVIAEEPLTREGCLGFAALVCDYISIEYDDLTLEDEFTKNESAATKKMKKLGGYI